MPKENKYSKHPEILVPIAEYFAEIIYNDLPNRTIHRDKGKIVSSDGYVDRREYTDTYFFEVNIDCVGVSMTFGLDKRDSDDIIVKNSAAPHVDIATVTQNLKYNYVRFEILFQSMGMEDLSYDSTTVIRRFTEALAPYLKDEIIKKPISLLGIEDVKVYYDKYKDIREVYSGYGEPRIICDEEERCCVELIKNMIIEEPTTPQSQEEYRKSKLKSW